MSITTDYKMINDTLIYALEGQLLEDTGLEKILADIEKKMKRSKGKIILELSALKYINSSGINFLIKIHKIALSYEKQLIILYPSKSVKNVLEISKMNEVFIMAQDLNDAFSIQYK